MNVAELAEADDDASFFKVGSELLVPSRGAREPAPAPPARGDDSGPWDGASRLGAREGAGAREGNGRVFASGISELLHFETDDFAELGSAFLSDHGDLAEDIYDSISECGSATNLLYQAELLWMLAESLPPNQLTSVAGNLLKVLSRRWEAADVAGPSIIANEEDGTVSAVSPPDSSASAGGETAAEEAAEHVLGRLLRNRAVVEALQGVVSQPCFADFVASAMQSAPTVSAANVQNCSAAQFRSLITALIQSLHASEEARVAGPELLFALGNQLMSMSETREEPALSFHPEGPAVVHDGIACNGCLLAQAGGDSERNGEAAIHGVRWHSTVDSSFNLCSKCEATGAFDEDFGPFTKLRKRADAYKHKDQPRHDSVRDGAPQTPPQVKVQVQGEDRTAMSGSTGQQGADQSSPEHHRGGQSELGVARNGPRCDDKGNEESEEENDDDDDDDADPDDLALASAAIANQLVGCVMLCGAEHQLQPFTANAAFVCEYCNRDVGRGNQLLGCTACAYFVCSECAFALASERADPGEGQGSEEMGVRQVHVAGGPADGQAAPPPAAVVAGPGSWVAAPLPAPAAPEGLADAPLYEEQMARLVGMDFLNLEANLAALRAAAGELDGAVELLLS